MASAELKVSADFSARTLGLSSTNTHLAQPVSGAAAVFAPQLNLNGSASYAASSNAFTGTLSNAGGTMTGCNFGRFYGPAAQELGGTFFLQSPTNREAFAGAYGARR